jgi:acetolactate synthase-1/2/3 large subunit
VKATELIVKCLENEGVDYIFGVPGEENMDLLDALLGSSIRVVVTRHEQGAAFMADVYGRLTGKAGVCLATLGPGATNLITGVADASMDRAPLVALTAQAARDRMHKESHQHLDIVTLFRSVTKWNTSLPTPDIIPEALRKAFKLAQSEKPGATHIEIPEDVARMETDGQPLLVQWPHPGGAAADQVEKAARIISDAAHPVVLAGNVLSGLPGPPRVLAAAIAQRFWFGAHSVGHLVLAVLTDSQQRVIENGPLLKSRKVLP